MAKRLFLGPIMIALLLGGLLLDRWIDAQPLPSWLWIPGFTAGETCPPGVVMFIAMLALVVVASGELAAILRDKGVQTSSRIATFASVTGLLASSLVPASASSIDAGAAVGTSAMLVMIVSIVHFSRHKTIEGVVAATGGAILAYVYLGLMFGFLLAIRREHPVMTVLWVLMITKVCDIGAYFTGTAIGKHKLIPWLSPGKTWEGLWGGVMLSALVGVFGGMLVGRVTGDDVPPWWACALMGATLGVVGQAGDLLESLLKRDAGKKDSGGSIPGFGGILDVLDSPLLAAPVAFWWLRIMGERGYF
jgi:phosphatidate cytidylyltransferase